MLLSQAIASQQSLYANIQAQIEELQEQQREIQAYLQRLGSVESKMESAAQLLQEAISEIQATCPDELPAYQNLITGLFGETPIAQLEARIEPEPTPTPTTTPENPSPTIDSKFDSTIDSNATITVTATAVNPPNTTTEVKEAGESQREWDYSKLSWKQLQRLSSRFGVSPKGKKRSEIETELNSLGINQSVIDKAA